MTASEHHSISTERGFGLYGVPTLYDFSSTVRDLLSDERFTSAVHKSISSSLPDHSLNLLNCYVGPGSELWGFARPFWAPPT